MEVSFQYNLENAEEIADNILKYINRKNLLLFYGEMGSGKTTLIKIICKKLNILDEVSSPTFSMVNEYKSESGRIFYHFDLFRLKSERELEGIGFSEYIYSQQVCFIEWPDIARNYLDMEQSLYLYLSFKTPDTRLITISNTRIDEANRF